MKKLPEAAIARLIKGVPADQVLVKDVKLTPKQKAFVREIAAGATSREAYMASHDPKGKPKTIRESARRVRNAPAVSMAIARHEALERVRYSQNPSQIREWLTDQLQHEARTAQRPGDRLRALELLGKLSQVGAFETRSVVEHRKAPDDMRQALLAKLARLGGVVDVQAVEAPPTAPPPPQTGPASRARTASINPHQQSPVHQQSIPHPLDSETGEPVSDVVWEEPPLSEEVGSHTGGGKKEKPLWEDPKRWYEHHYGEIKMEDEMPREEFAKRFQEAKDDPGAA